MIIFIGSKNPVKINAVTAAASETWPNVQVNGVDVPSGVPDQPRTENETRQGALNRALAALEDGLAGLETNAHDGQYLGVGLEGGVTEVGGELWNTVWVAVVDSEGNEFTVNGARFKIPEIVAKQLMAGEELGPLMSRLTSEENVKHKHGFIGIVTDKFVDRTEEYTAIAKLAMGLWYGRNWQSQIKVK